MRTGYLAQKTPGFHVTHSSGLRNGCAGCWARSSSLETKATSKIQFKYSYIFPTENIIGDILIPNTCSRFLSFDVKPHSQVKYQKQPDQPLIKMFGHMAFLLSLRQRPDTFDFNEREQINALDFHFLFPK